MKEFTIDELNRIYKTLEEDISNSINVDDSYYVYMLATKDESGKINPFYIGKGKGTRVFQHENDAEDIINAIEEVGEKSLEEEVSDKIKKIVHNRNQVIKYIVKWGLTSQEAFMCESSMINLYSCVFPGELTNIQNGHASEKEKNSRTHTTKAYEISEFLNDVCIENVYYEDTELVKKKCVFIHIENALAEYDKDCSEENRRIDYDEYVYQCAQGYWPYDIKRAKESDYVIALQNTIVKGIYPVAKWMTIAELRRSKEAPLYPISARKKDKNCSDAEFLKRRIGFIKINESDLTNAQQTELDLIKSQVLNKLIKEKNPKLGKKDWFKEQSSTYNYVVKKIRLI